MNNQTQQQIGRFTGRVEYDAGLTRYRGLLTTQRQAAVRGAPLRPRTATRPADQRRERRRVAATVLTALFLIAALSLAVMGDGATAGLLYLTSSCSGGVAVSRVPGSPESTALERSELAGQAAGSLEVFAAAAALDPEAQVYNGENCLGSCRFTR